MHQKPVKLVLKPRNLPILVITYKTAHKTSYLKTLQTAQGTCSCHDYQLTLYITKHLEHLQALRGQ